MEIPYFVLHAFASQPFAGSSAVVCMLQEPLDSTVLLSIAGESAALETTFLRPVDGGYEIRWFSRERELALCTHATLAAGAVVLRHLSPGQPRVTFIAESGPLEVTQASELFTLSLPRLSPSRLGEIPEALARGLRIPPAEVLQAGKFVAVYPDERDVRAVTPDRALLETLGVAGVIVTAPGSNVDFVLRSFNLEGSMLEESVSGSAFSRLVPYWSARLGKEALSSTQLSKRVGTIFGAERDGRVEISGPVVPFAHGRLYL